MMNCLRLLRVLIIWLWKYLQWAASPAWEGLVFRYPLCTYLEFPTSSQKLPFSLIPTYSVLWRSKACGLWVCALLLTSLTRLSSSWRVCGDFWGREWASSFWVGKAGLVRREWALAMRMGLASETTKVELRLVRLVASLRVGLWARRGGWASRMQFMALTSRACCFFLKNPSSTSAPSQSQSQCLTWSFTACSSSNSTSRLKNRALTLRPNCPSARGNSDLSPIIAILYDQNNYTPPPAPPPRPPSPPPQRPRQRASQKMGRKKKSWGGGDISKSRNF